MISLCFFVPIPKVDTWWDVLLPRVVPFLWEHGGPVVMVQVRRSAIGFSNGTKTFSAKYSNRHYIRQQQSAAQADKVCSTCYTVCPLTRSRLPIGSNILYRLYNTLNSVPWFFYQILLLPAATPSIATDTRHSYHCSITMECCASLAPRSKMSLVGTGQTPPTCAILCRQPAGTWGTSQSCECSR